MSVEANCFLKQTLLKKIHTTEHVDLYRMDVVAIFEDEKNLKEWCVANNVSWVRVGNGFNLKKE